MEQNLVMSISIIVIEMETSPYDKADADDNNKCMFDKPNKGKQTFSIVVCEFLGAVCEMKRRR